MLPANSFPIQTLASRKKAPFSPQSCASTSVSTFGLKEPTTKKSGLLDRFTKIHDEDIQKAFPWIPPTLITPRVFQAKYEQEKFELTELEADERHGSLPEGKKERNEIKKIWARVRLGKLGNKIEHERRVVARQYLPSSVKTRLRLYRYAITKRTLPNGKSGFSNYWWDRFLNGGKDVANSVLIQLEGAPSIKQAQAYVTGNKSQYNWNKAKLSALEDKKHFKKTFLSDTALARIGPSWVPNFAKRLFVKGSVFLAKRHIKKYIHKFENLEHLLSKVALADRAVFKKEINAIETKFSDLHPGKKLTVGKGIRSGSMAQAFKATDSDGQQYIVKIIRPEATPEKLDQYRVHQYYQNLIEYGADTNEKRYRAARDAEYMIDILKKEADLVAEMANQKDALDGFEGNNAYHLYDVVAALPNIVDNNGKTTQRSVLVSKSAGDLTLQDIFPSNEQQIALKKEFSGIKSQLAGFRAIRTANSSRQTQIEALEQRAHDIDLKLNLGNRKIAEILPQRFKTLILRDIKQLDDTPGNYTIQSDGTYGDGSPKVNPSEKLTSIDWGRSAKMHNTRYKGLQGMMKRYLMLRGLSTPLSVGDLLEDNMFRKSLRNYLDLNSTQLKHPLIKSLDNYETAIASNAPTLKNTKSEAIHQLTPLITFLLTQDKTNQRFRFPSKNLLRNMIPLEGKSVQVQQPDFSYKAETVDRPALLDVFYNEMVFNLIPKNEAYATPDTSDGNLEHQLVTNIPISFMAVKESRNKLRGMFGEAFICPYPTGSEVRELCDSIEKSAFALKPEERLDMKSIREQLHYPELFGELNMDVPLIPDKNFQKIPPLLNAMLKAMSEENESEFNEYRDQLIAIKKENPSHQKALRNIYAILLSLIPVIDHRLYEVSNELTSEWLKEDDVNSETTEKFEHNVAHAICYDLQDEIFNAGRAQILEYIMKLAKKN